MRRTVASALIGLALFGCGACTTSNAPAASSTPANTAAPESGGGGQPELNVPHQVSPVRPPPGLELQVELRPHAPGASCDQLIVDGQRSDLKSLDATARADVARNPQVAAQLFADSSCSPADVKQVSDTLTHAGVKNIINPGAGQAQHAATAPDAPPSDAERAAAQGTNAFAVGLYQQLIKGEKGNLFFSPTSVAGALALVDVGAGGKTASQLDAVLHTGLPHAQVPEAIAALLNRYQSTRGDATLDIANRVWAAQKFNFKPSYLAQVQQQFGAAAERVDFSSGDQARGIINSWVSQQTRGKITELLGRNAVGPDTQFVLTNAVYFYGTWKSPFDPKNTADAPFKLASGEQVQAPMMHQVVKAKGAETGDVQVVELPYGNQGTLAFDLILPKSANGLGALESQLSPEWLSKTLNGVQPAQATLAMPKFTERSQFALRPTLAAMGLDALFSGADLSAMADGAPSVSAVVHQAFVDVNEKGTEAAAATAVIGTRMLHREQQLTVTADHPFLFVIRDTATGGVLFMGRVADPRK